MENIKYVNPCVMEIIISNKLGICYNDLRKYILDIKVNLTVSEIVNYLDNKFEVENKFLKEKLKNYNYKYKGEKYLDMYNARKYTFDELTYKYFVKHISILKNKIICLLNIIDILINYKYRYLEIDDEIINKLIELDITVINGNISITDIDRITKPLIDNINELTDLYFLSNNLDTYSNFYINKDYLFRNGISFDDLFPLEDLQIKYGKYLNYKGYVPWSEKQKIKKVI